MTKYIHLTIQDSCSKMKKGMIFLVDRDIISKVDFHELVHSTEMPELETPYLILT